jgi:hypothetical protein
MAGSHWWNDQGVIELDPLRFQFDLNLIHLIANYCQLQLPIANCQLPIAGIANCQLLRVARTATSH